MYNSLVVCASGKILQNLLMRIHELKNPHSDGIHVLIVDGFEITVKIKPSLPLTTTIETVRVRLSEYLNTLSVTEEVDGIVVRPAGYLGRDKFASIAAIVRELGGNYISAGKESRFLIPKL